MKRLFTCLFGSKLYGTSTPTSDRDIKHVTLLDLDELLLGKQVKNTFKKTNNATNVRNSADDVDEEFIPLQVFARDFMRGQTYALELAFAVSGNHAEQEVFDDRFIDFCATLRERFLTSDIKAMMGYVVNQASLYSFKGERLNATRAVSELLNAFTDTDQIIDFENEFTVEALKLQAQFPKYIKVDEYDIGAGVFKPCLKLLEKTIPYTNTVSHSKVVVNALLKKYGSRADAASESNVDWKATMHALRIVDEGLMLLEQHKLSFPFEQSYVDRLLSIKRGEVDLNEVTGELSAKLDRLKELEKTTSLPALSHEMTAEFEEFLSGWLRDFYEIYEVAS
jgi:hypothetical protein